MNHIELLSAAVITTGTEVDRIRCMGCQRIVWVPRTYRGRKLRCKQCGELGLNITAMPPEPGANPRRKRREAYVQAPSMAREMRLQARVKAAPPRPAPPPPPP